MSRISTVRTHTSSNGQCCIHTHAYVRCVCKKKRQASNVNFYVPNVWYPTVTQSVSIKDSDTEIRVQTQDRPVLVKCHCMPADLMSVWSSWRVLQLRTVKSRVRLSGNIIFRLRLHQLVSVTVCQRLTKSHTSLV